ncbi:MAG: class I SAM-dependent methyltransferase, partial [Planctomycetota bacterium]|nr:class I SAM-dependent methyltransferase [Planctomycetota bacterium]
DLNEAPFDEVRESLSDVRRVNRYLSGYRVLLHHIRSFLENHRSERPFTILDLATGSADQPIAIVDFSRRRQVPVRVTALDINRKMLNYAREGIRNYPEIDLIQGNVHSPPFGENSFDIVFCSRVLLHIPYFEKALMNLYLVSKTLTFLILVVDDRDYVKKARIINVDKGTSSHWFFRYFSRHYLDKVINGMYAFYRIILGSGRYDSVVIFKGGRNL